MNNGMVFLLLVALGTSAFAQKNLYRPKYSTVLDSTKGKQLLRQCSRWVPEGVTEYWVPTKNDIARLEEQFLKVKKIRATDCCQTNATVRNLQSFAFQYIGVTLKNKKYIYLNAFRLVKDDDAFSEKWRTNPIVACDGGNSYWGVLFDLDKLAFRNLAINGIG